MSKAERGTPPAIGSMPRLPSCEGTPKEETMPLHEHVHADPPRREITRPGWKRPFTLLALLSAFLLISAGSAGPTTAAAQLTGLSGMCPSFLPPGATLLVDIGVVMVWGDSVAGVLDPFPSGPGDDPETRIPGRWELLFVRGVDYGGMLRLSTGPSDQDLDGVEMGCGRNKPPPPGELYPGQPRMFVDSDEPLFFEVDYPGPDPCEFQPDTLPLFDTPATPPPTEFCLLAVQLNADGLGSFAVGGRGRTPVSTRLRRLPPR